MWIDDDLFDAMYYGLYAFQPTKKSLRKVELVVFENQHTIIIDNFGNRYISRPEKGEKFDEEKGLLVALAKYDGHTTTEIQELLKGAIRKNAGESKKSGKKNKV